MYFGILFYKAWPNSWPKIKSTIMLQHASSHILTSSLAYENNIWSPWWFWPSWAKSIWIFLSIPLVIEPLIGLGLWISCGPRVGPWMDSLVVCPSFNSPNYCTFQSSENQLILHIKNSFKYSISNRILLLVSQDIFICEWNHT